MSSGTTSGHDFWYHFMGMTSGTTSGNDFQYPFRVWLLVPLPAMISGIPSGYDFRYHFWVWLPVSLPGMTPGANSGQSRDLLISVSQHYYVAPNWHLKTALRHSLGPWHLTWSQKCSPRPHSPLWISKKKSMYYLIYIEICNLFFSPAKLAVNPQVCIT